MSSSCLHAGDFIPPVSCLPPLPPSFAPPEEGSKADGEELGSGVRTLSPSAMDTGQYSSLQETSRHPELSSTLARRFSLPLHPSPGWQIL